MRIKWTLIAMLSVFLFSCAQNSADSEAEQPSGAKETRVADPSGVSKEERLQRIKELEAEALSQGDEPNQQVARKLMGEYIDFVNFQHDDPLVPEYMFRAGTWANYLGRKKKAVELFESLHQNYPSYEKRVEALNMVAFIYDFELQEKEKAKEAYALLIKTYPDHPLANDARARLETIDMTDEEMIKYFEKKNKAS
jgi:tetratricopeptide (TPR) repeat protein